MQNRQRKDYQTLSVFLILGGLTLLFVLGMRLVLFAPNQGPQGQSPTAIQSIKTP